MPWSSIGKSTTIMKSVPSAGSPSQTPSIFSWLNSSCSMPLVLGFDILFWSCSINSLLSSDFVGV